MDDQLVPESTDNQEIEPEEPDQQDQLYEKLPQPQDNLSCDNLIKEENESAKSVSEHHNQSAIMQGNEVDVDAQNISTVLEQRF